MDRRTKGYSNVYTFNVAKELERNKHWHELAKNCDSWQELRAKLFAEGIRRTPSGLRLDDRRVSWKALTMIIRDKYA
jgi:hypothetical protein